MPVRPGRTARSTGSAKLLRPDAQPAQARPGRSEKEADGGLGRPGSPGDAASDGKPVECTTRDNRAYRVLPVRVAMATAFQKAA